MNDRTNIVICKNIKFYCQKDKDAFFEWAKRLEFIEDVVQVDASSLELHLACSQLGEMAFYDLIALLHRYKVDMRQLQKFASPLNRRGIMDRKAFWWKPIFGEKGPIIKNGLVLRPLSFFSPEDKEFFLDWVQAVRHIESYRLKNNVLYANLYSTPISPEDLKNLIGIFRRYNLDDSGQLKECFGRKENQHLFDALMEEKA